MSEVEDQFRLILAEAGANHNKFYNAHLYDSGQILVEYGRVGKKGQQKTYDGGRPQFDKLRLQKEKKGYTEQYTVANTSTQKINNSSLKETAVRDIGGDNRVQDLIQWLADVNVHEITSSTNITFNQEQGTFSTPLGLVTSDGINKARNILNDVSDYVYNQNFDQTFSQLVSDYLRIIPQDVGMRRGWDERLLGTSDKLSQQYDILDSLDASLQQAIQTDDTSEQQERVFEVQVEPVEDDKSIQYIRRKFREDKGNHGTVRHLDLKQAFSIEIPSMREGFEQDGQKVGNVQQLWHGSKPSNLLSILKQGLIIPPFKPGFCTGRYFGDGLYFSNNSTKSLQYTGGFAPGQSRSNINRYFMLLADVAMGKPYEARGSVNRLPNGYDSVWCKPGTVFRNDERIVYRTSQANLKYLLEFTPNGR